MKFRVPVGVIAPDMARGLGAVIGGLAAGGSIFSESQLFTGGFEGFSYDATDENTSFQDDRAESPITTGGQTTAFILDKSQGAGFNGTLFTGLGEQFFPNPTFDGALSAWDNSNSNGVSIVDGRLRLLSSGISFSRSELPITGLAFGDFYVASGDLFPVLGSAVYIAPRAFFDLISDATEDTFVQAVYRSTATSTTYTVGFRDTTAENSVAEFDNLSLRKLPGNHGQQGGGTQRPQRNAGGWWVFDGTNDNVLTRHNTASTATYAVRMRGTTAGRVALGCSGDGTNRAFIGLASDGSVAAGVGGQDMTTIKGTVDRRDEWVTAIVTWDGTTVTLYENGTEIYSAAQSGAVSVSQPILLGCLNNNGTASDYWGGDIAKAVKVDKVLSDEERADLVAAWANIGS